jgi:GMP synthase (glutamine-hydrolysing)
LAPSHIIVIDPAVKKAELECFNRLVSCAPLPLTYHLPALFGMDSLEQEREKAAGVILLGSGSSVNDALPWQLALSKWLLPRLHAKVPVLGLCFGHQFIAHLFGARVEQKWPTEKKQKGFRDVTLKSNRLWGEKKTGPLYVSHNEVVSNCPDGFEVVGTSALVAIEALAHQTLPVWTFQAHPEATPGFTKNESDEKLSFGHMLVQAFFQFLC